MHPIDLTPNVTFKLKLSLKAFGVWVLLSRSLLLCLAPANKLNFPLPQTMSVIWAFERAERTQVLFGNSNRKDKRVSEHKRGWFSSF